MTFHGSSTARSNSLPKNISGCAITYWSSASGNAIITTRASRPFLPTRPIRCQDEVIDPGIADQHAHVEAAHVDPQLEGAGGENGEKVSLEKARLDLPPLLREDTPHGMGRDAA